MEDVIEKARQDYGRAADQLIEDLLVIACEHGFVPDDDFHAQVSEWRALSSEVAPGSDEPSRSVSSQAAGRDELQLSDEEKAAPFMSDLSDEAAGRCLKYVEKLFLSAMEEGGRKLDRLPDEGVSISVTTSAALFLVRHCIDVNAGEVTFDFGDVDIDGHKVCDWKITIARALPPAPEGEA